MTRAQVAGGTPARGLDVGPAGIEPTTSTVKTQHFAGELVDIFTGRTLGAEEVA